jgi:hypothetical protein
MQLSHKEAQEAQEIVKKGGFVPLPTYLVLLVPLCGKKIT